MRTPPGWLLPLLAVVCGLFAVYVAATGGVDTRLAGFPVRSRSWERPAALAAILGLLVLLRTPRAVIAAFSARLGQAGPRMGRLLAATAACWAGTAAIIFGTFVAGGSDSYGYVSQAELLARGRLRDPLPVHVARFTWPDAAATFAPLGYAADAPDRLLVPTYPPGYPLLMAPLAAIYPRAVFLLVPLCAAAAVWLCWHLGSAFAHPTAGALAALLLSTSPTFLYQAVQPMSDVPATTFWTAALVVAWRRGRWSAMSAGAIASMAILIRPNLAPLAILIVAAAATADRRSAVPRAITCAVALLPGIVALGAIQAVRYGSPFASGYGSFDDLFSLDNLAINVGRYSRWLTETHTPFIWLWLLAPVWIVRAVKPIRGRAWTAYAFCTAVMAAYLPYAVFNPEEWSYTRFLLPAVPLMLVLGLVLIAELTRRAVPGLAAPATAGLAIALAVALISEGRSAGVFGLRAAERRYETTGTFVRDHLPAAAVVLAGQHSGSIRYYSGRPIVRWDLLPPSLDSVLRELREAGYEPYAVLDSHEMSGFDERFGATPRPLTERLTLLAVTDGTRVFAFPGAPLARGPSSAQISSPAVNPPR